MESQACKLACKNPLYCIQTDLNLGPRLDVILDVKFAFHSKHQYFSEDDDNQQYDVHSMSMIITVTIAYGMSSTAHIKMEALALFALPSNTSILSMLFLQAMRMTCSASRMCSVDFRISS